MDRMKTRIAILAAALACVAPASADAAPSWLEPQLLDASAAMTDDAAALWAYYSTQRCRRVPARAAYVCTMRVRYVWNSVDVDRDYRLLVEVDGWTILPKSPPAIRRNR
jgi:hypothetical protein